MSKKVKRLFEQFQPENYQLHIQPDAKKMTFSGEVVIAGRKTGRPSSRITLHQKDLKILSAKLIKIDKFGEKPIDISRINQHKSYDEVRLHTEQQLFPGRYSIELEFSGTITKAMNGLYPCFFKDKGKDKTLLATQFESHHAREVFPCIDEPEAKATFDLTLTAPRDEVILSNTPVKKESAKGSLKDTTFEQTPIMSSYLLAFVIGELAKKEKLSPSGVKVQVYSTPDNIEKTDFALDTAIACLEFYNDYFGIDYPLPVCALVALPDFASGAMENWGLVTFREQCMLVDSKNSTLSSKQYVAMVVAHELAHQWFGNLVTMRWWTDLWLNEGFASWIEYLAVDDIFPDWQMWTQFIVDEQESALKLDALEHTHPIEVPVNHPDEIRTIFDAISYNKGASVIHMLHEFLGKNDFRDGLRLYLKKNAYGNTDTVDLWQALEEVSKKPVTEFMQTWTSQSGFPIIKVCTDSITQQRFLINPASKKKDGSIWPIATLSNGNLPDIIDKKTIKIDGDESLRINQNRSGFYRLAYDQRILKSISSDIKSGKISQIDRLGVLSDIIEASKAGLSSTREALDFMEAFASEQDYPVWDILAEGLAAIKRVMDDEDLRQMMKLYTSRLVAKQLARLGWEKKAKESHFDQLLRPLILGLSAISDDKETVAKCQKLFAQASVKNNPVEADLRSVVYNTVARLGGKAEFDKLLAMHNTATLSEERTRLAGAITRFKQPPLVDKALAQINSKSVRLQDIGYWLGFSLMNRHARMATWKWIKSNWQWLDEHIGSDLGFYRMPIYVGQSFSDEKFIKEYQTFFEPMLSPALDRPYKQGLEFLQWQSAWKKRDLADVKKYFQASRPVPKK